MKDFRYESPTDKTLSPFTKAKRKYRNIYCMIAKQKMKSIFPDENSCENEPLQKNNFVEKQNDFEKKKNNTEVKKLQEKDLNK